MLKTIIYKYLGMASVALFFLACTPSIVGKKVNKTVPLNYNNSQDSTNSAKVQWKDFFTDPYLNVLIDTALRNNQELNITLQEIIIARNEVRFRKGEYLPFVNLYAGAGVDRVGRYTRQGSLEANSNNQIEPGKEFPNYLPDYIVAANVSWQVDIWHKLRNAKKAAVSRYLASVEGRNFMVTRLVAEIANSYYELLALDNQLEIIKQNIDIQSNALEIVRLQKIAARVTELAVRRFEAQVLNTRSLQFKIQQRIIETENRINFLTGRYPQPISRDFKNFSSLVHNTIQAGIPSQLLQNRPDIRQAEFNMTAANLDVKSAKANFYPSLNISAAIGLESFNATYLLKTPQSMLFSLFGGLTAPLINRNAIKATYYSANARQIQTVYNYQRTILNAYIEVANQLSNISNLEKSYDLKAKQVEALTESIEISNGLFRSARADYMEVLLTQRDALESKFELIETKRQQMNAMVNIYQALGGGWNYR